jgi:hypothetical protein
MDSDNRLKVAVAMVQMDATNSRASTTLSLANARIQFSLSLVAKVEDTIVIPANSAFDLKVKKPASYTCMYK